MKQQEFISDKTSFRQTNCGGRRRITVWDKNNNNTEKKKVNIRTFDIFVHLFSYMRTFMSNQLR